MPEGLEEKASPFDAVPVNGEMNLHLLPSKKAHSGRSSHLPASFRPTSCSICSGAPNPGACSAAHSPSQSAHLAHKFTDRYNFCNFNNRNIKILLHDFETT